MNLTVTAEPAEWSTYPPEACAKCGTLTRTWWRRGVMPMCRDCAETTTSAEAKAIHAEWKKS